MTQMMMDPATNQPADPMADPTEQQRIGQNPNQGAPDPHAPLLEAGQYLDEMGNVAGSPVVAAPKKRAKRKGKGEPIKRGPKKSAKSKKKATLTLTSAPTTSEALSPQTTPAPGIPLTPGQKRRLTKRSGIAPRQSAETKASVAPQTKEPVQASTKPLDQAVVHVMDYLVTARTTVGSGALYVWRECLSNTGHVVRWTNWDPIQREKFAKKLDAAVTPEAVRQAIRRAASFSPDVPFNRKRGAVYAIMCIGWNIFYAGVGEDGDN